jgi:exopolysaccharide biosynthesis WecB/TagA/CpsF family protein
LLGAGPGVAEMASENINNNVKRKLVVDTYSPSFGFENNDDENGFIVRKINESGASVLAVGVGAPKQEQWILSHRSRLHNIRIFMAVGASIDFQAGVKKRSPKWMSNVGLEWFYRLINEPRRLCKRYLINDVPFLWLILRQRLDLYKIEEDMK